MVLSSSPSAVPAAARPERGDNYKWVALANTTFGAGGCAVAAIASWSRGKRYVYRPSVTAAAPSVDGVPEGVVAPERAEV